MVRAARFAFSALCLAILAACSTVPMAGGGGGGDVRLERDFAGRFYAKGAFTNTLTGAQRPFTTTFNGYRHGGLFLLNERIAFEDGERQNVTWRMKKVGPGRYVGRREDVIGTADVREEGGVLRLSYDVKLSGGTQVHFEDVIERTGEGGLLNKAVVSKFGVPVGNVEIRFGKSLAAIR
jgi:hypothetical protein